jgi:hypothetical protein
VSPSLAVQYSITTSPTPYRSAAQFGLFFAHKQTLWARFESDANDPSRKCSRSAPTSAYEGKAENICSLRVLLVVTRIGPFRVRARCPLTQRTSQAYRPAPPSPTRTNGAQKAG